MFFSYYFPELMCGRGSFKSEEEAKEHALKSEEFSQGFYFEIGKGYAPPGGGIPWADFDSRFDLEE